MGLRRALPRSPRAGEAPGFEVGCSAEGTVSAEHSGDLNASAGQMAVRAARPSTGTRGEGAGRARALPACLSPPAPGAGSCHQTKRFSGGQLYQWGVSQQILNLASGCTHGLRSLFILLNSRLWEFPVWLKFPQTRTL